MASLFFWRKKQAPAIPPPAPVAAAAPGADAAPVQAPAPPDAPEATPTAQRLPVHRLVHAIALADERAAEADARLDAAQQQLLLDASSEFARVGTEPRYTPHRPSLLPQLLDAINDEDASLRSLSRIVGQDPKLTGELLRTANSPLYRVTATPVESVERAVTLLGTQGIRTLIAASLVKPLAQDKGATPGLFGETIWETSLYSASAAEAWAARSQDSDPFAAHLLALMHGLGSVTVYRILADLYAARSLRPDAAAIASALATNAAVTAARIAANWGLSERTCQALESQSSAAPVTEPSALARALTFGQLAGDITLLCRNGRLTEEQALEQFEMAGYTGTQVQRVWDRLVRAYVRP